MGDPPGKEKDRRCRRKIRGTLRRMDMQKITGMVERHDDHHQAAGDIDCGEPFHICDRWVELK